MTMTEDQIAQATARIIAAALGDDDPNAAVLYRMIRDAYRSGGRHGASAATRRLGLPPTLGLLVADFDLRGIAVHRGGDAEPTERCRVPWLASAG